MRSMAVMIAMLLLVVSVSTVPVYAGDDTGSTDSDSLDNTYPGVEPRVPVQSRPSVSGPSDAQVMSSSDDVGGTDDGN